MSSEVNEMPLIDRLRIISLAEAARLANVSLDTLKRCHRDKIIRLSPRRQGMRQGDALRLNIDVNDRS
jgi:hypothetical protein